MDSFFFFFFNLISIYFLFSFHIRIDIHTNIDHLGQINTNLEKRKERKLLHKGIELESPHPQVRKRKEKKEINNTKTLL